MLSLNSSNKFAEWTKIIILYCDGALFQGYNKNPVEFNGQKIYFRGSKIVRAHFKWVDEHYSFTNAKKVVLAGGSSGGIGVYFWIDYLRGLMNDPKKLYGIVDSGYFMDPQSLGKFALQASQILPFFAPNALLAPSSGAATNNQAGGSVTLDPNQGSRTGATSQVQDNINSGIPKDAGAAPTLPSDSIKQFMTLSNPDERLPNKNCLNTLASPSDDWQCVFVPKAVLNIDTKMLWLNSQYDSFVAKNVLGMSCISDSFPSMFTPKKCSPPELLLLDFYRGLVNTHVIAELAKQGHSIWSNACSWHVATSDSNIYDYRRINAPFIGQRHTAKEIVEAYIFNNKKFVIMDQYPWPSNPLCAY